MANNNENDILQYLLNNINSFKTEKERLDAIFGKTEPAPQMTQKHTIAVKMALEGLTVENIKNGILIFVKDFYEDEFEFCKKNDVPLSIIYFFKDKKGQPNKSELIQFCSPVFSSKIVFDKFRDFLPESIQKVLEHLIFVEFMSEIDMHKLLEYQPYQIEKNRYGILSIEMDSKWSFFQIKRLTNSYEKNNVPNFEITFPAELKNVIRSYYPIPEKAVLKPIEEINLPKSTKIFLGEKSISNDLLKIIAFQLQDNIKFTARNKPAVASVNKIRKALKTEEFFENNTKIGTLRSYLLGVLMIDFNKKSMREDFASQLKLIFTNIIKKPDIVEQILYHLKGFQYIYSSDFDKNLVDIVEFIEKLQPNEWYSVENLLLNLQYNQVKLSPVSSTYALNNYIHYEEKHETRTMYYNEKNYIRVVQNHKLIGIPYFKGILALFTTLGVLDAAIEEANFEKFPVTYTSDYDIIRHIRLTPLGEYVLGLKKTYDANTSTTGGKLNFAEDSLIILAEGDITLYEILLKNYAEKITESRFRVTHQTFLKDCKNKRELKQKIDTFKQTVSSALPKNWTDFLSELDTKSLIFKEQNNLIVYQIPVINKDLQKLIAQDKILKEIVIKAEEFYVLMKRDNHSKFKARMKEFGYLID